MAAYIIVDVDIRDRAAYDGYAAGVPALIRKHGGEFLVRGGATEVLEGHWKAHRIVVLKFPDMAAAKAFHDDPEYQPLKALRQSIAETQMVVVEGV